LSRPARSASNRLIAALPRADRVRFLSRCDEVDLEYGATLAEPGDRLRHVIFPCNGSFISLVTTQSGRSSLEVGLVGREGMHGVSAVLGVNTLPLKALVQGGGPAIRISVAAFRREMTQSAALQQGLNRYLYVVMEQIAQSAACARFHVIEARLARWLLMTQDRADSDRFHITHAFLSLMLGARRAGVTQAARSLQSRGLINYKRGDITVLNRRGLEAAACMCYHTDNDTYRRVLGRSV
jgi:CRP-like cAMP-binding protein